MTIDSILEKLYTDLNPWVTQRKGSLSIARDPWNALEILINSPQGFLVILHWGGDASEGEQPTEPLSSNIIEVIISYHLGLQAKPDLALMKNEAERPSLLKYLNDLRSRVLSYVYPEEETMQYLEYAGCDPVVLPDGVPLAAYKFRVKLTARVDRDEQLRGSVETTEE